MGINTANLDVGSSKAAGNIIDSFDPRLRDPARFIVRAWGYLLVVFVLYLLFISVITENVIGLLIWCATYTIYLISLEVYRRIWTDRYDKRGFHVFRIVVNILMISWLSYLTTEFTYLIGFFYLIPIFAGIVYFADKIWVGISVIVISIICVFLNEWLSPSSQQNYLKVILLSVGITVLSVFMYWLYHRAIKSTSHFSYILWDLHRTSDIYELITRTANNAIQISNATHSLVIIIDPQSKRYVDHIAIGFELQDGASIEDVAKECRVLSNLEPFDCPDIISIFKENNIYSKYFKQQPKSVLAEPLFDIEGRIIGVLNVGHNEVGHFENLEKTQLKVFSGAVSTAIANCLSYRKAKLIEAMGIGNDDDFESTSDENNIINVLARKIKEKFPNADGFDIHRYDSASEVLKPAYSSNKHSGNNGFAVPAFSYGVGIAGQSLLLKESLLIQNVKEHPWFVADKNSNHIQSLLVAPIIDPDSDLQFGTISIYSNIKQIWGIREEFNLTCISIQAAYAFTRAKQLKELQDKGSALKAISDEIFNFDVREGEAQLYNKITSVAVKTLDFEAARLRILDEQTNSFVTKSISGLEDDLTDRIINHQISIPALEIEHFLISKYRIERSYFINRDDQEWKNFIQKYFHITDQTLNKQAGWRAYSVLITPLIGQDGRTIGLLTLDMPKDGLSPNPKTLEAIGVFSSVSAWALELARAQNKINEQRQRSWDLLESLGPKLASIKDFDSLGELIVQFGTQIIKVEGCSLHIVRDSEQSSELELTHSTYLAGTRYIHKKKPISKNNRCGLSSWVAATGDELCFENEEHKNYPAWAREEDHLIYLESQHCHSLLIVPVKRMDGNIIGVITLENKISSSGLRNFDEEDKRRIRLLALQFSQAIEMMEKYELIQKWERKGIEDELHDIINWYHSGVVLGLDALSEWFRRKKYSKVKKELPLILKRAYTSVNELKTVHTNLSKSVISDLSFRDELNSMVLDWINRATPRYDGPIKIQIECDELLKIPELLQTSLVKIASGAVANSILHSKITLNPNISINIKVEKIENYIKLKISDNGIGKTNIKEGYGITRMKHLTNLLINKYKVTDAKFNISSSRETGTTIIVEVWYPQSQLHFKQGESL